MTMTAKQLAEKLLENPNATVEVEITYPDSEYLGRDIVVHEVKLEGVSDERNGLGSKVVAKKIKIGKRIL